MLMLLADAAPAMTGADYAQILGAVGSVGFSIWFGYHTTSTTIPNMQKDHREALVALTIRFDQTIKEMAVTHAAAIRELLAELKAEREDFDRWRMAGK